MANVNRRDFLRFVVSGTALAALSYCAPAGPSPEPLPASVTPMPTSVREPTSVPTISPTPTATPFLLRNENRPGFYIRYYRPFEPVDSETWVLSVEGRVRYPQRLSFEDIQAFPHILQTSRLTCVEGWSFAAQWEGFAPQGLVDMVEPFEDAGWVHFYCADDYYESLALGEFLLPRVLLAYRMNGALLSPEYGAPLRMIVPFKYGYKGAKAITRIVFADKELRGYWPTVGPYMTEGQIQPGMDYALDLQSYRKVSGHGEVFYDDGIESQHRDP